MYRHTYRQVRHASPIFRTLARKAIIGTHCVNRGSITQPEGACPNCWRVWLAGPRSAIGYCWHGRVAWRVKIGAELAVAAGVTREEHRAMLEYMNEIELLAQPPPGAQDLQARPRL